MPAPNTTHQPDAPTAHSCRRLSARSAIKSLCARCSTARLCAPGFFISDAGTGEGMGSETIVAVSGLVGLGAAVLTGALWDSPLVSALLRLRENLRSQGRHAMPR